MKVVRLEFRDERTPYSPLFEDVYFSPVSGIEESNEVYIEGSGFAESLASGKPRITVAEIGFGVGLNFVLTVRHFQTALFDCAGLGSATGRRDWKDSAFASEPDRPASLSPSWLARVGKNRILPIPSAGPVPLPCTIKEGSLGASTNSPVLEYISFEKHPVHRDDLVRLYSAYPELARSSSALLQAYPLLVPGVHSIRLFDGRVRLTLVLGDAAAMLGKMQFQADHWYWDGFAPSRNPDAFSDEIFTEVARHSKKEARGSSFTSAGWVRRALESAGFQVTKVPGYGRKRERLTGVFAAAPRTSPKLPHLIVQGNETGSAESGEMIPLLPSGRGSRTRAHQSGSRESEKSESLPSLLPIAPPNSAQSNGAVWSLQGLSPPPWFSQKNHSRLSPDRNRVAIIGAGLAGSAVARSLAGRGAVVRVFDAHGIATRASGNPAGLFNTQISKLPNPISRFAQASLAHFLRELDSLRVPARRGILRKDFSDPAPLIASEYPEDFYELRENGTFFGLAGMLNPAELCRARLDHPGISLQADAVIRVEREGEEFSLHHPSGAVSRGFHHVVYTMGADPRLPGSAPLLHPLLDALPTRPIRGQILLLRPTPESARLPHCLVEEGYLTPLAPEITKNEFHLLGATYQAKTILPDQEEIDTARLLEDAGKWPEIGKFTRDHVVSTRTGYRMSTPDKLPLIGPVVDPAWLRDAYQRTLRGARQIAGPDLEPEPGEWMLTGLGSRGITYSSYGAEILASMMTGEMPPIELDLLEHVHSARFFVRKLRDVTIK